MLIRVQAIENMAKEQTPVPTLTTNSGSPVEDNQNSVIAGPRGPVLLQDYWLLEKLPQEIQLRQLCHFFRADLGYGFGVAKALGIELSEDVVRNLVSASTNNGELVAAGKCRVRTDVIPVWVDRIVKKLTHSSHEFRR